jgi:hypothetical protein
MLAKYHFKIKYVKGIDNIKANVLSRKAELQSSEKLLDAMLHINKNRKIRYNYLKLTVTHKALILN